MKSYLEYLVEQFKFEINKDHALTPDEKNIIKDKLDQLVELISNMRVNKSI